MPLQCAFAPVNFRQRVNSPALKMFFTRPVRVPARALHYVTEFLKVVKKASKTLDLKGLKRALELQLVKVDANPARPGFVPGTPRRLGFLVYAGSRV